MITSVYSIADTAMVGQYHGPQGTVAPAVVAPIWNIIYSLGLLMSIGGSVILSTKRGNKKSDGSENKYFASAVIGAFWTVLSMACPNVYIRIFMTPTPCIWLPILSELMRCHSCCCR